VFDSKDVIEDVLDTEQNRRVRRYVDVTWMQAPAPGCVVLSNQELSLAAARSENRLQEVRQLAEELRARGWRLDTDHALFIDELHPHTVTALFGLSLTDHDFFWQGNSLANSLVTHVARHSQFRPELRGLFRIYWRALTTYAKYKERELGGWLLDHRSDEDHFSGLAWQIAWCVSRGGIANVVAGLRTELNSSDLDECAAALVLIADAADYAVQSEAPLFGGGAVPERLAPNSPFLVVVESTSEGVRSRSSQEVTTVRAQPQPEIERRERGQYVVWFGTNRQPVWRGGLVTGFSAARDETVHYGWCRVAIPESHRIGSTGSPWWRRLLTLRDDRLKLARLVTTSADEHWTQIAKALNRKIDEDRAVLVFIHGYNVSFMEATIRAAQLGFDLNISGAMAFYSWPSQGTLAGYVLDEASIEASEGYIADYLVEMATKTQAARVHVLAHSMGNRGVLRAVDRIAASASKRSATPFDQIILAAADVDQDTFRRLSVAYQAVARHTTMYVCDKDRAVEASSWLHGYPRAGLTPPVLVVPGIDTVNVSNLDLTLLGHGYVAEARDVLQDMHYVLRGNTPPERRFGLRSATTADGQRYWVVDR
jgi:esterase/lipase superfamily enzyme